MNMIRKGKVHSVEKGGHHGTDRVHLQPVLSGSLILREHLKGEVAPEVHYFCASFWRNLSLKSHYAPSVPG
jgi:hypothetical protein